MTNGGTNQVERAFRMLQAGQLESAVPILKAHVASHPDDLEALHNLGMALSDLARLDEAMEFLHKALEVDRKHTDTLVALGVAYQRSRMPQEALGYLLMALDEEPDNPYAHRNIGAVLGNLGRYEEAEPHFRSAYEASPRDQMNVYGLAMCLKELAGDEKLNEADDLLKEAISINGTSQLAELARRERSKIAQANLRAAVGGAPRMDAVMYCIGALEKFETMSPERVKAIALEIAILGRSGLDVNNPESRYRLKNMPGDFSGLHLMSLMYVAFKQIAPEADIQFDLGKEYESALKLHSGKPQP